MASSGPNSPGAVVDDNAVGTGTWNNPGNAASSNNSYALASIPGFSYATYHYLKATNYGFSIPTGATIDGVVLEIEKKKDSGSSVLDVTVSLVKGGSVSGNNKALTSTEWPTSDTYVSYGGASDLWGLTLAPGDVNASDFGAVLSHKQKRSGKGGEYAYVDHIRITVYYTEGGGGGSTFKPSRALLGVGW